MILQTFASGSSGNCALVSGGGAYILLDAGISLRRIKNSLALMDLKLEDISAVLLTHEHSDHVCALPMLEKYTDIPVLTSGGTARSIIAKGKASGKNFRIIEPGAELELDGMTVRPFPTPHDAAESLGFGFEAGGERAAAVTDIGHITGEVRRAVCGASTVMLEANHDVGMLRSGAYPYPLQRRILGDYGHLSNDAAAEFALELVRSGTRNLLLAHLSRENNTPSAAYKAVADGLIAGGVQRGEISLSIAPADEPGCIMEA